ncbi:MAG: hypothetical protein P9L96_05215 [Candidatus Gygaella obscura]|nr:hypothetical protein [Candidatus Gygaella obscura]
MKSIKFDFNNFFSDSIGSAHGISIKDIQRSKPLISKSHVHLKRLLSNQFNRVNLNLEWAQLPYQNQKDILKIKRLANYIVRHFDNVLFLGIGGSYLGLKSAQDALAMPYYNEFACLKARKPKIYFEGNNLDPDTLAVLLKSLKPKKTFVVVISKSGETIETKSAFAIVENWFKRSVGLCYGRQIIAITDPVSGSLRKKVNIENAKDRLSFRSLPLLKGVGGRYSEFNMGLLHLAIIGVDINDVLKGAKDMDRICSKPNVFDNPAYMYALCEYLLCKGKKKDISILMPFCESLKSTADWYCQLLAESTGKKYRRKIKIDSKGLEIWLPDKKVTATVGRTPIAARGTNDLHSIQQNNIEGINNKTITFIRVQDFKNEITINKRNDFIDKKRLSQLMGIAQEATEWALTQAKRPNCTIVLPKLSPYYWAGLLFFFEKATAFEGELLNIDAYNQPGVEGYKNYMYYKLNKPGISKSISSMIKKNPLLKKKKYII